VLGNRTRLQRGDAETHYAYDPASQLLAAEGHGRRTEYRYDPAGRLTEEREADGRDDDAGPRPGEEHREARRHRAISYNGFGQPVSVTRTWPGRTERIQSVFNGNALLASTTLASEDTRTEEQRGSLARYRWDSSQVPQILAQHAEPSLDDAERDRPGRLDADFAYGYGRTFASWEHGAAVFHTDAFGSAVRTEATEPWAQASRYGTFGTPVGLLDREPAEQRGHRHEYPDGPGEPDDPGEPDHEEHPRPERPHWPDDDWPERPHWPDDDWPEPADRPHLETPELPRFGYRGELALGPMIYLRARAYDSELGRFTTPDPLAAQPRVVAAVSPYVYASNDPLNITDPSGLFSFGSLVSSVVHVVKHVVSGAQHAVHAVTGAITRGADVVAGRVAHAFEAVHSVLDQVAATAAKDAARVVHVVRDAATHVVHAVSDAVSRSVGIVKSTVTQATTWIKKHNQIIGKIGAFLSNVSGDLALAGLVIAPIPGLDALTPVLEGAALATSLGALATQGVARAAGDQNITIGDLLGDSLGAIPGGGDAEDVERGIQTASHATEDVTDATPRFFRGARPGEDPTFAPRPNEYKVDPATGTVRPTHGVSVFDNPGSVASKGFEPHEVNQSTIPSQLHIIQRGADPHHYEIVPQLGTSLTPEDFADLLGQISCFPGG
jgi:RHS repeat-associated protein